MRTPPSRWARCKKCRAELSYYVGSIRWQCRDDDLCVKCDSEKSVGEIMERFKTSLSAALEGGGKT